MSILFRKLDRKAICGWLGRACGDVILTRFVGVTLCSVSEREKEEWMQNGAAARDFDLTIELLGRSFNIYVSSRRLNIIDLHKSQLFFTIVVNYSYRPTGQRCWIGVFMGNVFRPTLVNQFVFSRTVFDCNMIMIICCCCCNVFSFN